MVKKIIETERLLLRGAGDKKSDADDLIEGLSDIEVSKWLLVIPCPYTKDLAQEYIQKCKNQYESEDNKKFPFLIEQKSENKVIGGIGLNSIDNIQGTGSLGYWINKKYHKKGYASEALKAVVDFAFNELGLRRLEAGVYVGNPSSAKLLEKFGAKQEGLKRKSRICKADGKIKDELIYGLLKEDYLS